MAKRVCSQPGCPVLVEQGARGGRCATHERARDQARGTRQQRGYDAAYDREREGYVNRLARGEVLTCWRCARVIYPHDFSLGHCDDDRAVIHGPEHLTACNLANTRGRCTHMSHRPPT